MANEMSSSVPAEALASPIASELDVARAYRLHARDVARWAGRLYGKDAPLGDLVQEIFEIALRKKRSFHSGGDARAWLFGIARNVVRSARRRRAKDSKHAPLDGPATNTASHERDPFASAVHAEDMARLYRLLDVLNERYRTAFVLHELEGCEIAEAAQLMNVKPATFAVLVHRARASFHRALEREERAR